MLAERVREWVREAEQEGFEKGRKEGREEGLVEGRKRGRAALVRQLERRFGPLPQEVLLRFESLDHEEDHRAERWLRGVREDDFSCGIQDLEDIQALLADGARELKRLWQQDAYERTYRTSFERGCTEGLEEVREKGCAALIRLLEKRFGPLPQEARQRIESLDVEAIVDLIATCLRPLRSRLWD